MNESLHQKTINSRLNLLRNVDVFRDTTEEVLIAIARVLKEIVVLKEEVVFRKGDVGHSMFIIVEGTVRVHVGNHVLTRLNSGSVFGEYALYDRELRSASITAETKTDLLELGHQDFAELMVQNIDLMKGVLKMVLKRIREMNELEQKLAKSYLEIQKQKSEIEFQHKNIHQQKVELEKKNSELIKLNDEKHHLINVFAHDLRNPLTSSLCLTDLFISQPENLSKDQGKSIGIIDNSLRRINNIINQILDINEIETKNISLKPEKTNLAILLHEIHELYQYGIAQKNIRLTLDTENLFANVDPNYAKLIYENLLSNAIKFSQAGKNIIVRLFKKDEMARVEIVDEGPGISDHDINKLFGKYQKQVSNDNNLSGSEGIGLSIVKKYVEAMNGKVWCVSEPGKGATLIVEFRII
ncbi:MAG: cyclic nucleotide-binding domain-containing protein [Bacteroidales bacterium]|nr:cyclic nucleotide-binding domain-containing protein [Bacteroidales bacterium]